MLHLELGRELGRPAAVVVAGLQRPWLRLGVSAVVSPVTPSKEGPARSDAESDGAEDADADPGLGSGAQTATPRG